MSTEPLECAREATTGSEEPATPDNQTEAKVDLPYRISVEHCYSRLVPLRSSPPPCSTSQTASFPTSVLFADRISDKSRLNGRLKRSDSVDQFKHIPNEMEIDDSDTESEEDEDKPVDVVAVEPVTDLPYDERKVSSIMVECSRHINLVKVPAENSDILLSKAIQDAGYHRKVLLRQLVDILEGDHLARLACANAPHEPIKRRLNTDKAARQFRKALADVSWDPKTTRYCHETLLQVLSVDLLPIYLDILQVLKAKCPVLIENMIHSSVSLVGNEAFGLLLKRPWNPAVGLPTVEKQVRFDPAPVFVSLPYSTTGLGGRRWRMLQSQLSITGKVYPVMVPERLTDMAHGFSLDDIAQQMMLTSLARVQELQLQYPTRPVVLIGFSVAGRIAAKVAEIEPVSCIVSLGLSAVGLNHKWKVSSDPFKDCKTPTVFVTGSESELCSVEYIEDLRSRMKCPTSLVVIGGGDDLLRLSADDKAAETICQSIVDRCILDKIHEFMVYNLPCSYPEEQVRLVRKRKSSHTEDIGSTFLTPAIAQSPIRLNSPTEDMPDSKNVNFNNSNPLRRTYLSLKQGGRISPATSSRSGTPSPVVSLEKRLPSEGLAYHKKSLIAPEIPKVGRPRSKSTSDKSNRRISLRSRSSSSDQSKRKTTPSLTFSSPANAFPSNLLSLNSNSNNSNFNTSPPGILSIPQAHIRPLPVTPPRNPFEDIKGITGFELDPKTLKQLYKGK